MDGPPGRHIWVHLATDSTSKGPPGAPSGVQSPASCRCCVQELGSWGKPAGCRLDPRTCTHTHSHSLTHTTVSTHVGTFTQPPMRHPHSLSHMQAHSHMSTFTPTCVCVCEHTRMLAHTCVCVLSHNALPAHCTSMLAHSQAHMCARMCRHTPLPSLTHIQTGSMRVSFSTLEHTSSGMELCPLPSVTEPGLSHLEEEGLS